MYSFESIQQIKGVTPAQGFNGPPLVELPKYERICKKMLQNHWLSADWYDYILKSWQRIKEISKSENFNA